MMTLRMDLSWLVEEEEKKKKMDWIWSSRRMEGMRHWVIGVNKWMDELLMTDCLLFVVWIEMNVVGIKVKLCKREKEG